MFFEYDVLCCITWEFDSYKASNFTGQVTVWSIEYVTLVVMTGITILVPYHIIQYTATHLKMGCR